MSAFGYERTFSHPLNYVRFSPESGHSEGSREMSAFDPKRTLERVLEPELSDAGLLGVM